MSLLFTFLILSAILIAIFWGGSMFLQGWLYQAPAERMPIRAVVSGTVVALFLTLWCWLDVKNPGKYETLLEFSSSDIKDYDEFKSLQKRPNGKEEEVLYKKRHGSQGLASDFVNTEGKQWSRGNSQSIAVAILIKEPNKQEWTRFNANLDKNKQTGKEEFPTELRYVEEKGSRYMNGETPGRVHRKKMGVFLGNILLNTLHFVVWWMAFWLGVRFLIWHAFGFAFAIWLFTMVAVQPVLFGLNRPTEPATETRPA